jgi:hypothetical protein
MVMNGFIRKAALGLCLGCSLGVLSGCHQSYRELVDPCWPERYNAQARQSVRDAFNAQAYNGHVLDQTVWNQHFEVNKDKLTKVGEDHLKYLSRRRPAPDPKVYVQTSHDAVGNRKALDEARVKAVQTYLTDLMAGRNMPMSFEVVVHDAPEPGIPARAAPSVFVRPALGASTTAPGQPGTVTTGGYQQQGQMTGGAATGYAADPNLQQSQNPPQR